MKALVPILLSLAMPLLPPAAAGAVAVVDINLIRTNLANARRDLIEQILQGERQVMQYQQLVAQVRQIDLYLERFGDPASVELRALEEARRFLGRVLPGKASGEIFEAIDDTELFAGPVAAGHPPVSRQIRLDGRTLGELDPAGYRPELASRRALAHFDEVRDAVLLRRRELQAGLDSAMLELRAAATASEVAKLDIVIRSLESRLADTATDLLLAGSAVEVHRHRLENEERIAAKAAVEVGRALLEENTRRELRTLPLPNRPILFQRHSHRPR